jgi:cell division transport system ATP-binding protein
MSPSKSKTTAVSTPSFQQPSGSLSTPRAEAAWFERTDRPGADRPEEDTRGLEMAGLAKAASIAGEAAVGYHGPAKSGSPLVLGAPHHFTMIRFDHVTKSYKGTTVALADVCVDIQKGEFVFLVGPSGSGKSTFLRLVTKEDPPNSGEIWVAGKDIASLSHWKVPYLRRNIGCVFQDFRLLPTKTVYENVAFALEVIGRPRHVVRSQVPQILDLVGLGKKVDSFPNELSGGEQQRVAIARAFVNRPLILLADEPTGNLDPTTTTGIMRLLDRINQTGTTVVMATHDQNIVDAMRRRVIELDRGSVVRDQERGVYGMVQA